MMELVGLDSKKNSSFSVYSKYTKFRVLYFFMTVPQLYSSVTPRPSLTYSLRMRINSYPYSLDSSLRMMRTKSRIRAELLAKFPHYYSEDPEEEAGDNLATSLILVNGATDEADSEPED